MKKTDLALSHPELLDVFELSRNHLLAIIFSKTPSPYYKLAVNIASGAQVYRTFDIDKTTVHMCAFAKTPTESARALAVIEYVRGWANTQILVGGRMLVRNAYYLQQTLRCFQDSAACESIEAHCVVVVTEAVRQRHVSRGGGLNISITVHEGQAPPPEPAIPLPRYEMPCKHAWQPRMLDPDHPATLAQQVQAFAVGRDVAWCPNFDMRRFKLQEAESGESDA